MQGADASSSVQSVHIINYDISNDDRENLSKKKNFKYQEISKIGSWTQDKLVIIIIEIINLLCFIPVLETKQKLDKK